MLYTQLSQYAEAERCFQNALEQRQRREDIMNYANTLGELAEMYFAWGRWEITRQTLDTEADLLKNHPEAGTQALYRELETRRRKLGLET
jgi:tetratricopeptide (TPR) repeat protein